LFDGARLRGDACVIAVGSHEPQAREVDAVTVGRSTVVTESRGTALREAGDILMAIDEGAVGPDVIAGNIADLVHGRVGIAEDRPRLFKSVGMGWEDLTVAAAVYDHNYPGGAA
ncbi:MAG: ornithine cyclodeaminase family protein, partial [Jiangellaceae bacterium]